MAVTKQKKKQFLNFFFQFYIFFNIIYYQIGQCSSQQVPSSMPITHFPFSPPSSLILFSVFRSILWFASLSLCNYFFPFLLLSFLRCTYDWKHMISFSDWFVSLRTIPSSSIHVAANGRISFFLIAKWSHCIYKPHLLYPFIIWWTYRLSIIWLLLKVLL